MAIGVYFGKSGMTAAQYDEIMEKLDASGKFPGPGFISHVCFGTKDDLEVFDVWESEEDFTEFGKTLMPIIQVVGVAMPEPQIVPVYSKRP